MKYSKLTTAEMQELVNSNPEKFPGILNMRILENDPHYWLDCASAKAGLPAPELNSANDIPKYFEFLTQVLSKDICALILQVAER